MTTTKPKDRRLLQVTMKPDFYEEVRRYCAEIDVPMAIWARELMKRELQQPNQ
jgi:hypothetical protein